MRAPPVSIRRARRLRRDMSLPELILWDHLRGSRLAGLRFRRQHPLGPFILDFYCPAAKLCVEIDGAAHDSPDRAILDDRRTRWLGSQGIHVLRIPASDILRDDHLEAVLQWIADTAQASAPSTGSAGPPPP